MQGSFNEKQATLVSAARVTKQLNWDSEHYFSSGVNHEQFSGTPGGAASARSYLIQKLVSIEQLARRRRDYVGQLALSPRPAAPSAGAGAKKSARLK